MLEVNLTPVIQDPVIQIGRQTYNHLRLTGCNKMLRPAILNAVRKELTTRNNPGGRADGRP